MLIAAIISLVLGVLCGHYLFSPEIVHFFSFVADYALNILMFSVGVSVGANKSVFQKLKEYHIRILIIPFGIITGSLIGGIVCSLFMPYAMGVSMSIASAMGWYSLAGVLLTSLAGAKIGAVAFMSSLIREMMAFVLIAPIAKYLNNYTAIAPAAATSEDTTLPMLIKYTNEEVTVMAVFNGVLCSAAAPVFMRMFCNL